VIPDAKVAAAAESERVFTHSGRFEDAWAEFRQRFGGTWGLVTLSRLGSALTAVEHCCLPHRCEARGVEEGFTSSSTRRAGTGARAVALSWISEQRASRLQPAA
jgi:hypothetical protein